mmetsp:Transcript_9195/g.37745  ORF Transcript_9195/g.37745 Transcript_9195/m.37745 type:complete len:179 (+) Transcript_9195:917-1453(+)
MTSSEYYLLYRYSNELMDHNEQNASHSRGFNYGHAQPLYQEAEDYLLHLFEQFEQVYGLTPELHVQLVEPKAKVVSHLHHQMSQHSVPTEEVHQTTSPDIGPDDHLVTEADVCIEDTEAICLKGITGEDRVRYIKAISKEIVDVVRLGCFKLSLPQPGSKPIDTKIVLKIKTDADGTI